MTHYLYDGCDGCSPSEENTNNTTYEQNPPSAQNLYMRIRDSRYPLTDEQLYIDAINSWTKKGFKFKDNMEDAELNHYTAMNWKSATTVGCAISKDTGTYEETPVNKYYLTCQYGAPSEIELPNIRTSSSGENIKKNILCTEPLSI
jgi:hypothetical protein